MPSLSQRLMSFENYSPCRQHKGVWVYQTWKLKPHTITLPQSYPAPHVAVFCTHSTFMPPDEQTLEDLKRQQQSLKTTAVNMRREAIDASLSPDLRWSIMQARDKDASSWLNTVPLEEQELTLNKQQVWDSLRLRYNLQGADLPSHCACGDLFTVSHAPSWKTRSPEQIHRINLRGTWEREEREAPTKSYWRGNGIF